MAFFDQLTFHNIIVEASQPDPVDRNFGYIYVSYNRMIFLKNATRLRDKQIAVVAVETDCQATSHELV